MRGRRRPWRRDSGGLPQPTEPLLVDSEPKSGECRPTTCGYEAACKRLSSTTYTCICPHDSSPPTADLKCPRQTAKPVARFPTQDLRGGGGGPKSGECRPTTCGKEAACKRLSATTYTCICPHDSSPPTADLKCPRQTAKPVARFPTQDLRGGVRAGPQPGECQPGICGAEAACKRFPNATHMCLCPHDSSPPTADRKCPNRLTVPLTPRPIHNIIPPSGSNDTIITKTNISTSTEMAEKSNKHTRGPDLTMMGGAALLALILILILAGICWWKRKSLARLMCKTSNKIEAPLTGEPLLAERYITNPQYSSNPLYNEPAPQDPDVPLLHWDALTFLDVIGEGCFGKVYKGEFKVDNNTVKTVAIKVLKASKTAEDDFNREVKIVSAFRHVNILTLMGVVQRADNGHNHWMVFEFMVHGDLAKVLRSNSLVMRQPIPDLPPLDSRCLLSIALQIAYGMRYLAGKHFVHRDLACRNCLVGEGLAVKIADFGMSRDVYTSDYYKMGDSRPMPIRWMSPESIQYALFTLESDVWSYGVVLWEIYSLGKQPYYGHTNQGVSKLISDGIILSPPDDCPKFVCDLMSDCWRSKPIDRIGFRDICEKLLTVQESGGWESEAKLARDRNRTIGRAAKWTGELPRPPPALPLPPPCPPPCPPGPTDPEGYLLPVPAVPISDYITALPD